MIDIGTAITLGALAGAALAAGWISTRGYGLLQVRWLTLARLAELRARREETPDPAERRALDHILAHCEEVRGRWVLRLSDLDLARHTRVLAAQVAGEFHPEAARPLERARVGRALGALLEFKTHVQILAGLRGVRRLTRFRVRHLLLVARAWEQKRRWEHSRAGRLAARWRMFPLAQWLYTAWWAFDLAFWSLRMTRYLAEMLVFKIFLVRWYLLVGELALKVYRDRDPESEVSPDDVLADLDALSAPKEEPPEDLPEAVRALAGRSRKRILLRTRPLAWRDVRAIYEDLARDVAAHHHPEAQRPLEEARLYDLLLSAARLAEQVVALQSKPVINKILDLRFSHLLIVRDATETILNHELMELVRKYRVGTAVKYSSLIYKAFKKGHPGVLFRDFAFTLAREAAKRWVYVYLHDRLATEANRVYGESKTERD